MEPVLVPAWPQAAQALGIGKTKLYELLASGELKSVTLGRRRLVHVDEIRAFADRVAAA